MRSAQSKEAPRGRVADSDAQIIFYDHETGELADFLTLASRVDDVLATLFHCKASSPRNPGERVDDLYEVCAQAVSRPDGLTASRTSRTGLDIPQEAWNNREPSFPETYH